LTIQGKEIHEILTKLNLHLNIYLYFIRFMNFGGIGGVIAREMARAIDSKGKKSLIMFHNS